MIFLVKMVPVSGDTCEFFGGVQSTKPIASMGLVYLATFTVKFNQMSVNIPVPWMVGECTIYNNFALFKLPNFG